MANIIIKADDPNVALAISEGANAVELRTVKAEYARLNALNGVRQKADEKRWQRTRKRLARKYSIKPMNPVSKAVLVAWACLWYGLYTLAEHLTKEV